MILKTEREKLYTAFGLFQAEFRFFVISFLKERAGNDWIKDFENTLSPAQRRNWDKDLRRNINPEDLIDFNHFQSFAETYKELLKRDFPGKNQSLPTWLVEIAAVRNKLAHHNGIEEDEALQIWIYLRTIAKLLGKNDLVEEILELERNKVEEIPKHTELETIEDNRQPINNAIIQGKTEISSPKSRIDPMLSDSSETLDIVNCANAEFRQTVFSHEVYLCPAKGGAYKHKQCKYLGIYWEKRVGAVGEIVAVVDVHPENEAKIYWVNGNENVEDYIAEARKKALSLRSNDLPIRVFLLTNLHSTDFIKDSPGGMFGSKMYLNIEDLKAKDAMEIAKQLSGKKWSEFNL